MGLLRVVEETELNIPRLMQVWQDAAAWDGTTALCPMAGRLREGEKIIVAPGQIVLLISDGKLEDIIAAAGGYLYYPHLEADIRTREYAEALDGLIQAGVRIGGPEALLYLNAETLLRLAERIKRHPQEPQLLQQQSQLLQEPRLSRQEPQLSLQESQLLLEPQLLPPQPGSRKIYNFCPKCGYNLQMARQRYQSVRFCPGCGAALG